MTFGTRFLGLLVFAAVVSTFHVEAVANWASDDVVVSVDQSRAKLGDIRSASARVSVSTDGDRMNWLMTDGAPGTSVITVDGQSVTLPFANVAILGASVVHVSQSSLSFAVAQIPGARGNVYRPIALWFESGVMNFALADGPIIIDDLA